MAVLTLFLGLTLGYTTFYSVFPTVGVPAVGGVSFVGALLLLIGVAILGGFLTQDVYTGTVQSFVSLAVGIAVASLMMASPLLTGMVQARADDLAVLGIQLGFPIYLVAVPVNLFGGLIGLGLRERFAPGPVGGRAASSRFRGP